MTCEVVGKSVYAKLIGLDGDPADRIFTAIMPVLRSCSNNSRELDFAVANRFLSKSWAPEKYFRSYTTPASLSQAISLVRRDPKLKGELKKIKKYAVVHERGWKKDLIADL